MLAVRISTNDPSCVKTPGLDKRGLDAAGRATVLAYRKIDFPVPSALVKRGTLGTADLRVSHGFVSAGFFAAAVTFTKKDGLVDAIHEAVGHEAL